MSKFEEKKFICMGLMTFRLTPEIEEYSIQTLDDMCRGKEHMRDYYEEMFLTVHIADLMDGEEFYEAVDSRCIIDYDGFLDCIIVDGYKTNLGLCHEGLCQGQFLLNGELFLEYCKEHDVKVNWANK